MADLVVSNSTDTVIVRKLEIKAVTVEGLVIIFKMVSGPDIVYDTAPNQETLDTWISDLKDELNDD